MSWKPWPSPFLTRTRHNTVPALQRMTRKRPSLTIFPVKWHYNCAKSIVFTPTESWYSGLEWTTYSRVTVKQTLNQQILHWDWLLMTKGGQRVMAANKLVKWPAKRASNSRGLRVFLVNCTWRSRRPERNQCQIKIAFSWAASKAAGNFSSAQIFAGN